MATAMALPSQNSFDHETLSHRNGNSRRSRNSHATKTIPRRRKQTPPATVIKPLAANSNLVMGQVKILKRGETLPVVQNKKNNSSDRDVRQSDLIVSSVKRIGPEPKMMQNQIRALKGLEIVATGDYAGSGCSVSPPPSSVPIPCFLGKN